MHSFEKLGSTEPSPCVAGLAAAPIVALPGQGDQRRQSLDMRGCRIRAAPENRQPAGLYLLCAVEACAGFAFYMVSALLVLFLTEWVGQDQGTALRWVGTFNGLCYAGPLVGGLLADRVLGLRRSVRFGAALLCAGMVALALFPNVPAFALALLIGGSALFRSNIIAMVGRLYRLDDARRRSAYRLFYVAFNLGAMLAPLLAGVLIKAQRWRTPLVMSAGVMLFALLALQLGNARLAHADRPDDEDRDIPKEPDLPGGSFPRWLAICVIAQAVLLWKIAHGQSDGTLMLWARDYSRRFLLGVEVPPTVFVAVPALLVLLLTPMLGLAERSTAAPSAVGRLLAGLVCTSAAFGVMAGAAKFGGHPASALWLLLCLALLTLGEVLIIPIMLTLVSQLAPRGHSATSLALCYGASAAGLWCAGQLGALWESVSKSRFFVLLAIVPLLAALLVYLQSSSLRLPPSLFPQRSPGG